MSEKKPFYKKKWFIGIMIFLVLAAIGGILSDDEEVPQENPASSEIDTGEVEDIVEEIELTINDIVKNIIVDNLGEQTNMKHDRIIDITIEDLENDNKTIDITLVANENLTTNMTKSTIHKDSVEILEELYNHDEIEEVTLIWQLPLVDTYGNEETKNVMIVSINKEIANKINWSNFDYNNIPKIANDYWEHPAFNN
ncbi:hypothetical protein SAMN05446037_1002116 [Anaerovirgula multivorans]|uniref:Uncharacterized protein n=1 Tax=Anaerovirgula multivorans TaxID=312168 RepID=A0A239AM41_9FIRM|nr:hypothetical protein [Anaerovirgula multivorans]SNR96392.1 hypothetical protein SAMN05446037_1002116 [Anaerovirgula multivorans]